MKGMPKSERKGTCNSGSPGPAASRRWRHNPGKRGWLCRKRRATAYHAYQAIPLKAAGVPDRQRGKTLGGSLQPELTAIPPKRCDDDLDFHGDGRELAARADR